MAAAPGVTVVVNNRTSDRKNLNLYSYTKGYVTPTTSVPVISNQGFAGSLTSGTLLYQTVGPTSPAWMNFVNASGTIVDQWRFGNSENLTDALALIDAGVLAGTALITLTTSS